MKHGRSAHEHDVAIYSPSASAYYDEAASSQGGGAQLQMSFLARQLAVQGLRVAHIVFPVVKPIEIDEEHLTLFARPPYRASRLGPNGLREARAIWSALKAVDARTYVVRASGVNVAVMADFARVHRRGMVFSTANDFDLVKDAIHGSRLKHAVYLHGLRGADAVVVQSSQQLSMARDVARPGQRLEHIPSFAEPSEVGVTNPDMFLWVSRVTEYKRPLEFIRLARALPEARFLMITAKDVDDSESLRGELRRQADDLDNVEVVGPLRREEVMRHLEHTVAMVSTSGWEGMPNAFLEAWGRGVPTLSLSFDPDDLIAQRELGIAAGGSWQKFVDGAASLWSNVALREALGRNARSYVEERHSPAAVGMQWERLLREVAP